ERLAAQCESRAGPTERRSKSQPSAALELRGATAPRSVAGVRRGRGRAGLRQQLEPPGIEVIDAASDLEVTLLHELGERSALPRQAIGLELHVLAHRGGQGARLVQLLRLCDLRRRLDVPSERDDMRG